MKEKNDFEDIVSWMNLTFNENEKNLDEKSFGADFNTFSIPLGIKESEKKKHSKTHCTRKCEGWYYSECYNIESCFG